MARRRRRKKKNPTTAQKVVLAVGGVIGLGLLGTGIYMVVRKKPPELPADGLGGAGMAQASALNYIRGRGGIPRAT